MKFFVLGPIVTFLLLLTAYAQGPTNQLTVLGQFSLPNAEGRLAWDPPRRAVYSADTVTNKLYKLGIDNGSTLGEVVLTNVPERMALGPDGRELFVTLQADPGSVNGHLAVIDLDTFAETRRFEVGTDPFDVAVTPVGAVAISSDSGQWVPLFTYDAISGAQLGWYEGVIWVRSLLGLHPDGRRLYVSGGSVLQRLELDPQTRSFGRVGDPVLLLPSNMWRVWVHPAGQWLIGDSGDVLQLDEVATNDLRQVGNLGTSELNSLAFDVPHQAFFAGRFGLGNELLQYHLGTLQLAARYPLSGTPLAVAAAGEELWVAVATNTVGAVVQRLANPAVGGESNQPPVAAFTMNPSSPTTLSPVTFDAGASSDDQGPGIPLWYRWDLNADGVFDTEFTQNASVSTNFNVAGTKSVVLQARDRFGVLSTTTNSFTVQLAEDPGQLPPAQPAFRLPFAAARVVFDGKRGRLYAADPAGRRMDVLDLQTGSLLREYQFFRPPESLAITPDGQWLYVALLDRVHDSFFFGPGSGYVAEFDLERGVKTHEFAVGLDPGSLAATDARVVVVGGGSGQSTEIHGYAAITGERRGSGPVRELSPTALVPSRNVVLAVQPHTAGSEIGVYAVDPTTGILSERLDLYRNLNDCRGGLLTISDDETYAATARGSVFALSAQGGPLSPVWNVQFTAWAMLFDDPSRGMFFAAMDQELRCYNLRTFNLARTVPLSEIPTFLGRWGDLVYVVSVSGNSTTIRALTNPALGSEGNQPPTLRLVRSPTAPTTRYPVVLDAGGTTDDREPIETLRFRWDLNGDGTFDTSWTNTTVASQRFLVEGDYRVVLEAQDSWGAVSTAQADFHVATEADPGQAGPAHPPWRVPFAAADAAFDVGRRQLWLTDPLGQAVARVNLTNGLVERLWTFNYPPESLAITPDGRHLYAALLTHPHDYYWRDQLGYVAEFDLAADTETRVFRFNIDPGDLAATDSGLLFIAGGSGGDTSVDCYRLASGALTGRVPMYNGPTLRLAPSQTKVFAATYWDINPYLTRFAFDPASGAFGAGPQSPQFGPERDGVGGRVFVLPGETQLLGGGGAVYLDQPGAANDLRVVSSLGLSPITDVAELPGADLFATLSGPRIGYFRASSLASTGTYQLGRPAQFLGAFPDAHFVLSVDTNLTWISRRNLPASNPATNQAPSLRWLAPSSGQVFAWPASLRFLTEPEDGDGGIDSVQFREGDQVLGQATNYPFGLDLANLSAGNHLLEAVARDNLGATSQVATLGFRITLPPDIRWVSPVGITVVDPGANVPLEVTASDADGVVTEVRLYRDSIDPTNLLAALTQPPWRWVATNFTSTTYFIAQAIDNDTVMSNTPPALVQLAGPRGDDFYRPFALAGTNVLALASNAAATSQLFEKPMLGNGPYRSLWWSWSPPAAGIYEVSTRGSSFDTLLGVFVGTNVAQLTLVASNDDDANSVPGSTVKFAAYPGTTYALSVDGYSGAAGTVRLSLMLDRPLLMAPPNDRFTNRFVLTGTNVTVEASNLGATVESMEPNHAGILAGPSVWWEWTAPASGSVRLTTLGSDFDTILAVYTATTPSIGSLRGLVSNDDDPAGGPQSTVLFAASAGTRYYLAVTGFAGATGQIRLTLGLVPSSGVPPVNDAFASRQSLVGTNLLIEATNAGATTEATEPSVGFLASRATVWWSWRSSGWGPVYVRVQGGGFNAMVAVFTGNTFTNFQRVAASTDSAKPGMLTFQAIPGPDYAIAVDGQSGKTGPFTLTLSAPGLVGPPRLTIDPLQPGPAVVLRGVDCVAGTAVILASTDLVTWTPILTNEIAPGQPITFAPGPEPTSFYRLDFR